MINLEKFDKQILVQGERGVSPATLLRVEKGKGVYVNKEGEMFWVFPHPRVNDHVR